MKRLVGLIVIGGVLLGGLVWAGEKEDFQAKLDKLL